MNYSGFTFSEGSVLSFTLDPGWTVEFTDSKSGEEWKLPALGWAVVCRWSAEAEAIRERRDPDDVRKEIETCIEPVVLTDDSTAEPVSHYLLITSDHLPRHVDYKITRGDM